MADARSEAEQALATLAKQDGVLGAALVSRDGLVISQRFRSSCNVEAVCAMAAAMLGAADAAIQEVAGEEATRFAASAQGTHLAGEALDGEMLLVLLGGGKLTLESTEALLRNAATSLRGILQEA
jgi:predicted regulator of Ras-like GTPase activity (Roadblock/LC7/MglB family)